MKTNSIKTSSVSVTWHRFACLSAVLEEQVNLFSLNKTIKALVGSMWSGDNTVTCAISAPTRQASFNVATYLLFRLPIEHEGKTAGYWSLPKVSQKVMKTTNLREVKM